MIFEIYDDEVWKSALVLKCDHEQCIISKFSGNLPHLFWDKSVHFKNLSWTASEISQEFMGVLKIPPWKEYGWDQPLGLQSVWVSRTTFVVQFNSSRDPSLSSSLSRLIIRYFPAKFRDIRNRAKIRRQKDNSRRNWPSPKFFKSLLPLEDHDHLFHRSVPLSQWPHLQTSLHRPATSCRGSTQATTVASSRYTPPARDGCTRSDTSGRTSASPNARALHQL